MSVPVSPIRFARARRARLAYQVIGDGGPTIVSIPPLAQNIELATERPEIRRMLDRFGRFSRFVHFDKRGTGCSDRTTSRVAVLDERVDDLRAVMDAEGIERAHLFGNSEGGPMAILFAVTYPDRVESLTLWGTTPVFVPPEVGEERIAVWRTRRDEMIERWGTDRSEVVDTYAPTLGVDPDFRDWHRRYERNSATSDALRDLFDLLEEIDVRDVLDRVSVPTLVIHRTDDPIIPVSVGRELAAAIPEARFVEQPGVDHFGYAGDVDGWVDEVERFIAGEVTSPPVAPLRPPVRIVTLGRFGVVRGTEEVDQAEWGSRLARQLCKRLVVARGWPVTRDELMDLLWPEESDRSVLSARLSVQLSAVRRILGGGVIATRESVSLDLEEVSTDLERFFEARSDAEVVEACAGEFLPEDVYEDWAGPMRDVVRSRFGVAGRRLAAERLETGDVEGAVELAQRLVDADRFDDAAHRLSIRALRAAGQESSVRAAHARWAAAMGELDERVPPLEDLKDL